jgi:hypothetical protein
VLALFATRVPVLVSVSGAAAHAVTLLVGGDGEAQLPQLVDASGGGDLGTVVPGGVFVVAGAGFEAAAPDAGQPVDGAAEGVFVSEALGPLGVVAGAGAGGGRSAWTGPGREARR